MGDRLSVVFGGLTRETLDQVPAKCRRCPVFSFVDQQIIDGEADKRRTARQALKAQDATQNRVQPPERLGRLDREAAAAVQRYDSTADDLAANRQARDDLIEASGGCVIGAVLGDQTEKNIAMRAVSAAYPWIVFPLQRSCTNPAFESLQGDSTVATALEIGHWVGRTE